MEAKPFEFLQRLTSTPGVSGAEIPVQQVVADYARGFGANIRSDFHGNLILSVNEESPTRLMFAGHADQIGLIVSYIDETGFVFTQTVGGWDPQQLVGQAVTIWTKNGSVPGVISRKAIHLLDETERKKVVDPKSLWIDIGATTREEAQEKVQIGDTATLQLGLTRLLNDRVCGPAMDNRTGLWVVVEALRRAMASGNLAIGIYSAATVQEEIGLRGAQTAAFSINPQVGIAVDVTHATDCPDVDPKQQGNVSLGGGAVIVRGPNMHPLVSERLVQLAASNNIAHQVTALGRAAPNDSNALQVTRGGVATGLVSVPNRYMHSAVETISLADLEHCANLLCEFALSIKEANEFLSSF
ncbi:MAG: M42 family metallopeptidase [Pirellulaceae bacterium]